MTRHGILLAMLFSPFGQAIPFTHQGVIHFVGTLHAIPCYPITYQQLPALMCEHYSRPQLLHTDFTAPHIEIITQKVSSHESIIIIRYE
ncbi:hypothetical protein JFQ93_001478 [Aeromonas sobria]|nr:hypothetical protein [Aeromonas sobria]